MSEQDSTNYIEILLVEDNQADVVLTKRALKTGKVLHNLHVANDGEAALSFLHDVEYGQAPRPDLILLDLNLPKVNGREVLAKIKSNEALASIPVVVLTTSKSDEDIMKTYELHGNSFITKPVDWPQFMSVIQSIEEVLVHGCEAAAARELRMFARDRALNVLLIEDNPGDAHLIKRLLTKSSSTKHVLDAVNRLSAGIERCDQGSFDVVLLDLGLPDSQGFATVETMRAAVPHVPIIVLTGLDDLELAVHAVREGAQDYLVKGAATVDTLERAMYYAIERKNLEEQLTQSL